MKLNTSPDIIQAFWRALGRTPNHANTRRISDIYNTAACSGWIAHSDIEDLTIAADLWLPQIRIDDLLQVFEIPTRATYTNPGRRHTLAWGTDRVEKVDFANLLIRMEQTGLRVDPEPYVSRLAAPLKAKGLLTDSELAVYWYERERHRCEPMVIATATNLTWGRPDETLRTVTDYRAALWRNASGDAVALKITAPRYRATKRLTLSHAA